MRKGSVGTRDLAFLVLKYNHLFLLYMEFILTTLLVVIIFWCRDAYGVVCYNVSNQPREY
jgi:hypothetical protein